MASPAAENMPNGISTPPTTASASGAPNQSPPTAPSTQPTTQPSQQANGTSSAPAPMNPSFPSTSLQDSGLTRRPRDARLIHLVLANMGVHAYTERVPLQLLDFAYRYTSSILSDAAAYEPPAQVSAGGKKAKAEDDTISLNALRTAVGARAAQQFNACLPKEFMTEVASERNRVALPRVEREYGIRLPPERYCFTGVGWGLKEAWEEEVDDDGGDGGERGANANASGGVGTGGPVGAVGAGGEDTLMGGLEEEEVDEDEFEDAMGMGGDATMADG